MTAALLGTALAALAAAALLDLVRAPRLLAHLVACAAAVLLVIVGAIGLAGRQVRLGLDAALGTGLLSFGPTALSVDRLSGLFLVISFAVAVPVSLACAGWVPWRPTRRGLGALHCLVLGAVAMVTTADNVFLFMLAWELLTIAFYLLAGFDRTEPDRADAALVTVALGKVSEAALLLGFLLLAARAGGFGFADLATVPPSGLRDAAFALLVAGFAVKIGLVPVHVWMPQGYRAAPGPLRAVMAGVAVNVGFYGLWRTFDLLAVPPGGLAVALLLLGGVTALLGIAHVAVQTDLAEVVAYSSVENAGLITVGYGVALVGATVDQPTLVAVGLLAATLQIVTHAVAKSLLFCATSGIEDGTGTTELEALRGVGHRLPTSGTGLAIGALTLAGVPLTVGFVSEWFLLEALMQQFRISGLGYTLPMAVAGALVALTVGFAAVAFVRIVGMIVLGPRESDGQAPARDVGALGGALGGAAIALLGFGCVAVAAVGPLWLRMLAAGLDPIVGRDVTAGAIQPAWVLQPVYAEFSALSPSKLAVAMPLLLLGVVLLAAVAGRGRMITVRRVPAWRSATGGVAGENQYTPFGFANPTRKVLATVLLTRSELTTLERQSGGRTDDPHRDPAGAHLGYTTDVVEVVERFLFRPLAALLLAVVRAAKRLQNGRLDAYLAYMLLAVLAVLTVVVGLA
ncbi:MAG: NADH/ubiquinone/plastoquinone (complex I) [Pseudonocardiaceae bacterium]|nr:NADH/ubiquinone/plastoquinone (complex I) [Pseudonocardiaceae bacterium]